MKHFWAIVLTLVLGAILVCGIVYRKQIEVIWGDATRYLQRVNDEVEPGYKGLIK